MNIELSISHDEDLKRRDVTLRIDGNLWEFIERAAGALERFALTKRVGSRS